jgi:hypothetical protein
VQEGKDPHDWLTFMDVPAEAEMAA